MSEHEIDYSFLVSSGTFSIVYVIILEYTKTYACVRVCGDFFASRDVRLRHR